MILLPADDAALEPTWTLLQWPAVFVDDVVVAEVTVEVLRLAFPPSVRELMLSLPVFAAEEELEDEPAGEAENDELLSISN